MKAQLINGPFHGVEVDLQDSTEYVLLKEMTTGKIYRYDFQKTLIFRGEVPPDNTPGT